ncbi:MAG: nitroreductase family protein [Clostridiales bacterium]|nr:nitroreductase family protein [Clostridiales bacterium]
MDMLGTMLHRRSVRQYTGDGIADEKLNSILYAGLAAASSKNRRPCEFVVVRDREMLSKLGDCRPSAGNLLGQCDTAIVVAADSEQVDVWVEDAATAMTQMHLMADALGIGSCWLQVRLRTTPDGSRETQSVIRELLGIPDRYSVLAILTLGMPASHPGARKVEELPLQKIHRERF